MWEGRKPSSIGALIQIAQKDGEGYVELHQALHGLDQPLLGARGHLGSALFHPLVTSQEQRLGVDVHLFRLEEREEEVGEFACGSYRLLRSSRSAPPMDAQQQRALGS